MDIFLYISFPNLLLRLMKTINLVATFLVCIFFVNISSSQTVNKQQTNKEKLTKKTSTESNIKSEDFSKDEQKDIILPKKNSEIQKKLEVNRKLSKVKMVSPTTIIPNIIKTEDAQLEQTKDYKTKKQSYRPKYHQQRKIISNNKEETDD